MHADGLEPATMSCPEDLAREAGALRNAATEFATKTPCNSHVSAPGPMPATALNAVGSKLAAEPSLAAGGWYIGPKPAAGPVPANADPAVAPGPVLDVSSTAEHEAGSNDDGLRTEAGKISNNSNSNNCPEGRILIEINMVPLFCIDLISY